MAPLCPAAQNAADIRQEKVDTWHALMISWMFRRHERKRALIFVFTNVGAYLDLDA